ncbi:MAG: hypothetical protein ACOC8P_00335 [Dichotomicrobium sp.]
MSTYQDHQVIASRTDEGDIRLEQNDPGCEMADVILLTPDQLVRLGEWAKPWAKNRGPQ